MIATIRHLLQKNWLVEYQPFARLERINPLLRRELGWDQRFNISQTLLNFDGRFLTLSLSVHGFALCMFIWALLGTSPVPLIFVLLPSLAISIGADMYGSVRTILRWHEASQPETWDTLRLAMRDDIELLRTYEAISNVRSWSAYRADMSMRVGPAFIVGIIGVAFSITSPLSIFTVNGVVPLRGLTLFIFGIYIIRAMYLYVRDPMWRFWANTMWSLLCAIRFRDSATAIGVTVGGGILLRFAHIGAIIGLFILSRRVLAERDMFYANTDFPPMIIWFIALAILPLPITRWCYTRLYRWLTRRALYALRSGNV